MSARIHFDDNMYILELYLQTLKSALSLETDPEYFLDKCVEDIFFLDTTLSRLYKALQEQEYLIRRREHFRALLHCKQEFVDSIHSLLQGGMGMSPHVKPFSSRISQSMDRHEKDCEHIREHWLKDEEQLEAAPSGLSKEEYQFLLGED